MKQILFLGCSNLVNDNYPPKNKQDAWKEIVFGENVNIKNLSWWGVGNQFIAGNLFDYIENEPKPSYVYIQFTGLARYDIPVNQNFNINYNYQVKVYRRTWLCSGGKVGSWLGNSKTKVIFMPLYYTDDEYQHIAEQSLQSVASTINFLESKNINYNWNFYYDIINPANKNVDMYDGHVEKWPNYINQSRMITIDPHTFCHEKNGLHDDGCHFKNNVYEMWLNSIKYQLTFA
jgi:hypothetical protein